MDFRTNIVLKENYTFLVADAEGVVDGGEKGVYLRDTRFLSRYAWDVDAGLQTLLADTPRPDRFEAHLGRFEGHAQTLGVHRTLDLAAHDLRDRLTLRNDGLDPLQYRVRLRLAADFLDLFEARGFSEPPARTVARRVRDAVVRFEHRSADGVSLAVEARLVGRDAAADEDGGVWTGTLAPGGQVEIGADVRLEHPLDPVRPLPSYEAWRRAFGGEAEANAVGPASWSRAVDDLRGLMLHTEDGPVPAAGVPWYVAAFGRDALLSAHLVLPQAPAMTEGTLRTFARLQGRTHDPTRAEDPGKIAHEMRLGELARTGAIPHRPFFGTVDATPLFVWLVDAARQAGCSPGLVDELRPAWEAALGWMEGPGDADGDGFLEFDSSPGRPGAGLRVQSWKDAGDSMVHADGRLASGAIAVSEVQGYAYAAYRAAAHLYQALGEAEAAHRFEERARRLRNRFHEAFWLAPLDTYALALDGDKRPLEVLSSDAGQLLWTGIVPEEVAPHLVGTLFGDALWSGWGFRTLGAREVRYNPVSYHNGSVWPHDTALIALGLARYGFLEEARRVAMAVIELAEREPDRRLPELVAGYPRGASPAVPYPVACRPQAWDAAARVALARLLP